MEEKKLLVFYLYGTLIDSYPVIFKVINVLAKKYGYKPLTTREYENSKNMTYGQMLKLRKLSIYKIPFIINEGRAVMANYVEEIKLFKGIKEALRVLKEKNYSIGILTSNSKDSAEEILKLNGVFDIFKFIHSEFNIFGKKRALQKILKEQQIDKSKVLYFGDEIRDIKACKAAGIDIVAVTWGHHSEEILMKENPQYIIKTPEEITTLF
jgi:phosphoglycolate phosphatase